jgi:hypothetical protein
MDRQQEAITEDEVDLVRLGSALVAEGEQDEMDDLAERLDLRPLIGLGDVVGDEWMQLELLPDLPNEIRIRIDQVDPETAIGL